MMQTTRNGFASLPRWSVCARCVGHAARITVLCALLCAPVLAAEDEVSDRGDPAIPPGQEELVAAMLGRGETLPGGCALAGGGPDHTLIKAVYACPSGDVVFELDHPSTAADTATQTANFAITLQ